MSTKQSNNRRDYFPFFASFEDAINEIDDEAVKLALYKAIVRYGLYGEEPALQGIAHTMWVLMKPNLISSRKQYENGKKGGAPKGNKNAQRWTKPTYEDVCTYVAESGYNMNESEFFEYYEDHGWCSKNPKIKSWQQAADEWERRYNNFRDK